MTILDFDRLLAQNPAAFQSQEPFPWINPEGLLTASGYQRLLATLPDISLFTRTFGCRRKHGQQSHDRYALEYTEGLAVSDAWKEFIAELRSSAYRTFVRRMFQVTSFDMNFHWHYAPAGCSVSPHCDARRKLGSHIFYLNSPDTWDPAWGGETRVLDDRGRFRHNLAPGFEDFDSELPAATLGNYSFLFRRTEHSWHGVKSVACPPGQMRKVFIAVINRHVPAVWLRRLVGGMPRGY